MKFREDFGLLLPEEVRSAGHVIPLELCDYARSYGCIEVKECPGDMRDPDDNAFWSLYVIWLSRTAFSQERHLNKLCRSVGIRSKERYNLQGTRLTYVLK